jgi:hypothetical protein
LLTIKNILSNFADISGLRCNTEKTALMQIGNKIEISQEIKDLGFCITYNVHILGMDIDCDWYNLTMIGSINVIKSLLFSQILYLGSILTPSPSKLKNMQKLLDDFALDGTNIARDQITQPVEMGGGGG